MLLLLLPSARVAHPEFTVHIVMVLTYGAPLWKIILDGSIIPTDPTGDLCRLRPKPLELQDPKVLDHKPIWRPLDVEGPTWWKRGGYCNVEGKERSEGRAWCLGSSVTSGRAQEQSSKNENLRFDAGATDDPLHQVATGSGSPDRRCYSDRLSVANLWAPDWQVSLLARASPPRRQRGPQSRPPLTPSARSGGTHSFTIWPSFRRLRLLWLRSDLLLHPVTLPT